MTTFEQRLRSELRESAARTQPAPDLFARVTDDVTNDRLLRHQRRVTAGVVIAVLGAHAMVLVAFTSTVEGRILMPWWVLELVTTSLLVVIALWLGPFIKRFGRAYAADVFHDNPQTGKSYIVLTDIVYYLIFTAYILFTVQVQAPDVTVGSDPGLVTAEQVQYNLARVGGILLIIGILHGLNIVLMPILGRLFSLNRRFSPQSRPDTEE